ncbi:hypothetical protein ACOMHN_000292 [Nucella lapillus]
MTNDLTRRQANIVAQARRDGKRAFFKNGVMVVGPALPDPRTYAEVTATDSDNNTGASARRQRNTACVSPPVRHASDQGGRHENSPSDVNRGQRCDDMRATGGEGEGNFTRAVHATPPDINRDRDTASPLCDAGPSHGSGGRERGKGISWVRCSGPYQ